jgi:hypothetical protein
MPQNAHTPNIAVVILAYEFILHLVMRTAGTKVGSEYALFVNQHAKG